MFIQKLLKKQVSLLAVTLVIAGIIVMGSSYALFSQTVIDDENEQALSIGDLTIRFSNSTGGKLTNSNKIDLTNVNPMSDSLALTKEDNLYTFAIHNEGTIAYTYTIMLKDDESYTTNLLSHEAIRYKLNNETIKFLSDNPSSGAIKTYTINPGETQTYTLRLWVADPDTYDLSNDIIGKEAHLNIIIEGEASEYRAPIGWYEAPKTSLLGSIRDTAKDNTKLSTGDTDKDNCTLTYPGRAVATCDEGLRATEDDYGTSYYYRGAVENNYVKFADMCWRIVRIDGNGNIKLTLYNYKKTADRTGDNVSNPCHGDHDATDAAFARYDDTANGQAGKSSFNLGFVASNNGNVYFPSYNAAVDLKYGILVKAKGNLTDEEAYNIEHANTNNSTILTNLLTWFNNTNVLSNEDKAKIATVSYCNDKSVVSDTTYDPSSITPSGLGYGQEKTYYQTSKRLNPYNTANPVLTCPEGLSRIESNVWLLSADEVAYAGTIYSASNITKYYLYRNASGNYCWTSSPAYFNGNAAYVMQVYGTGGLTDKFSIDYSFGLRPVIALSPNIIVSYLEGATGDKGTSTNPFVIE